MRAALPLSFLLTTVYCLLSTVYCLLLPRDAQRLARFYLVRVVADHVLVGLVDVAPGDAVVLADGRERVAALDGVAGTAAAAALAPTAAADFEVQDEVARAHVRVEAVVLVPDLLLRVLAGRGARDVQHVALLRHLKVRDAALVGEVYERLIFLPDCHSPCPPTSCR